MLIFRFVFHVGLYVYCLIVLFSMDLSTTIWKKRPSGCSSQWCLIIAVCRPNSAYAKCQLSVTATLASHIYWPAIVVL